MPVWIFMLEVFGRERSTFFHVWVCLANAASYRDLTCKQIYKKHENKKKRQYAERVMEIEQGTFTPLVFTTVGGMADECVRYHSRLAELIENKNRESYSSAISWIRAKVSFSHNTLCDTMLERLKSQKTTARLCWHRSTDRKYYSLQELINFLKDF